MKKEKKYVVVRGDRSGVFAGFLDRLKGQEVTLSDARKLWYWDGAGAIEQIALDGVSKPNNCKFTVIVKSISILDVIQVIPCTQKAKECIQGVAQWRA